MHLSHTQEERRFREDVRQFLKEALPEEIASRTRRGFRPLAADVRRWTSILNEKGWSAPSWPRAFGGTGWSPPLRHIFEEECFLAGAPQLWTQGVSLVGPCIIRFGSDAQKAKYLPGILSGAALWAQGFSEPGAGSDLASLRTRAVRDGAHYILNGEKIWTSDLHEADFVFVLARTNPGPKPQQGISFFLVDANAEGLTHRPIPSIDGGNSLNHMLLENVRVRAEDRVGEEDQGWAYAKALLSDERAFHAELPRNKFYLRRLKALAASEPGGASHIVRAQIARLEVELDSLEFLTLATMNQPAESEARSRSSVLKIRGSELSQKLTALAVQVLGDHAAAAITQDNADAADWPPQAPGVSSSYLIRRASSIAGGSNEIQRNIIAKQTLRL